MLWVVSEVVAFLRRLAGRCPVHGRQVHYRTCIDCWMDSVDDAGLQAETLHDRNLAFDEWGRVVPRVEVSSGNALVEALLRQQAEERMRARGEALTDEDCRRVVELLRNQTERPFEEEQLTTEECQRVVEGLAACVDAWNARDKDAPAAFGTLPDPPSPLAQTTDQLRLDRGNRAQEILDGEAESTLALLYKALYARGLRIGDVDQVIAKALKKELGES